MNNERDISRKKHVIERVEKGHFAKGKSANPNGRPKGSKNYSILLEEAIGEAERKKDKKFLDRVMERAYMNDVVMLAVLKKLIPDKSHAKIETEFIDKTIDEAEQESERKVVEKLKQDPEYKKRIFKHYKEGKRLLAERDS